MTLDEPRFTARRIVVAIDASAASLDALEAATAIAEHMGSELRGVFVEDEDLLRLAALPFGELVLSPGGGRQRVDPAAAELALRAVASRARQALERSATRHGVSWSFRVSRGHVSREVLAAAAEADLVVLGSSSHGRPARGAVGTTARATAEGAPGPVLLLSRGAHLAGGVVAIDDGTPQAARARAVALALAAEGRQPTLVRTVGSDPDALAAAVRRAGGELAVVPAGIAGSVAERLLAAGLAVAVVR
jgi:nucleotide-binding universal stress UspA family protein